jgi:hypothetical protein
VCESGGFGGHLFLRRCLVNLAICRWLSSYDRQ